MPKRRSLNALSLALAGALALGAGSASAADPQTLASLNADPLRLYGGAIDFDVYRNGDKVGFHEVRFNGEPDDLTVSTRFQVEVDVLFFTAYRFDYASEGRWRGDELLRLTVSVDDDGNANEIDAVREADRFTVANSEEAFETEAPLFPTNHWNPRVVTQDRVLNTLTGRVNSVSIEPKAREIVATERGAVPATRYAYSGQLETEVWYDDEGRWVKMRFEGRDGSEIEYVCRRCQGLELAHASP